MPGVVLHAFHLLIDSILATLEVGTIIFSHFTDKGTEEQRDEVICLGSHGQLKGDLGFRARALTWDLGFRNTPW